MQRIGPIGTELAAVYSSGNFSSDLRDTMTYLRTFWLLLLLFAGIFGYRVWTGQVGSAVLGVETVYSYSQTFRLNAAPGEVSLRAFIPRDEHRIRVFDEGFDAGTFGLEVESSPAGRQLVVAAPSVSRSGTVTYRAHLLLERRAWEVDPELRWSDLDVDAVAHLDSTATVQTGHTRVRARLVDLLGLAPDSPPTDRESWQKSARERGVLPLSAIRSIFDFCYEGLRSATYSGTTDAVTALSLGEASCGGKSRLMAAMCRTLGIPTRLVGGVILGDATRKRTSHVWVECSLAGEWISFDPLNGHFAEVPENYLQLYVGDEPMIQHSRGLAFDYAFYSTGERFPKLWLAEIKQQEDESGPRIPLLRRSGFSILILAPLALLLTVFLRQIVGLDSMGVFLPVLLGYSLSETGWILGGGQLLLAVGIGILFRHWLGRLQMMHLPRNAIVITALVVLFLGLSIVTDSTGATDEASSILLPLAALAMTIERYTLLAMDKGHRSALSLLTQTFVIAAGCWLVLSSDFYRVLIVAHPEVFLLVIAQIILIGNYRGLRLREFWRFRQVIGARP